MSGICDKCMRKPCSGKGEGLIFCDFYIRAERNYDKLFGTPDRAARTIAAVCSYYDLSAVCSADCENNDCYDALLEWLESDAVDEPDTIRNELIDSGLLEDVQNELIQKVFEMARKA